MAYSSEPRGDRPQELTVNAQEPFNAEPPVPILRSNYITPNAYFYVRNHGPVPLVKETDYRLTVTGLVGRPLTLSLMDIKQRFPKKTVMATIMCAGNRRTEMSTQVKPVRGVGWGLAAISNATWSGALLRDVLLAADVSRDDRGSIHASFVGMDSVKEEGGNGYGSSIPLDKAIDDKGDVILAYEMNGIPLPRDHGFPLRVVVPGYVGARSVKWLATVVVQKEESESFFQQLDYKILPSHVDWGTPNLARYWKTSPALQELNVQAAICSPQDGSAISNGLSFTVQGYAIAGGGRRIVRVEVSVNGGETWTEASLFSSEQPYKQFSNTYWAWTFWSLYLERFPSPCVIICRAWDSSFNCMPEDGSKMWNLRGVMNNCWHRVSVLDTAKL